MGYLHDLEEVGDDVAQVAGLRKATVPPKWGGQVQKSATFKRLAKRAAWLMGCLFILRDTLHHPARAEGYDCVIEPYATVKLASSVEGVVARLDVNRGDVVSRGQVIGKLDDALEEAEVALAAARAGNDFAIKTNKARQEFMQRKLARNEKLKATDAVADAKLEEAITEARVAELARQEAELAQRIARLELRRAEEALSRRTFRSPIDGIIVERVLSPGEYRHAQSHIVTIAQIDPLRVEVFLPTSAYGRIRAGSRAVVQPQQPVGGTYPGTIVVIDKVLDAASGTFGVRLEIPNPGNQLPAGLRCTVTFETKEAAAD